MIKRVSARNFLVNKDKMTLTCAKTASICHKERWLSQNGINQNSGLKVAWLVVSGKALQFLMSLAIINTAKPADAEDRPVKFIFMSACIPRCLMLRTTAKVDVQIILRSKFVAKALNRSWRIGFNVSIRNHNTPPKPNTFATHS